ncbi:phosphomannomutase [Methylorubrum sp. GM97]|uniref:phosphomannomutase n=1 Tax=Methylorubrum sp. GM97 TaxID=2938232 RepID=UPI002189DD34|nr:phosphomannomutase [Methylorubrum sp. GM97]BDL41086.1 phosphomannomutase [Methylorubrum sp. GM97]
MDDLKFGTSGLRGLVTKLVGAPTYKYTYAFCKSVALTGDCRRVLLVGYDLRSSSAGIADTVADAAIEAGFEVFDCGAVPTPALALEAIRMNALAVMVTGSHIPDDRNGLKFYRPDGEITKDDEKLIASFITDFGHAIHVTKSASPRIKHRCAIENYARRYLDVFSPSSLSGLRIIVYQQSSVSRDLLASILESLGATVSLIGRSDAFVPIDTEAHGIDDIQFISNVMSNNEFDALVTTDGDGDRPLVADASGNIVPGDILGLIASLYLAADSVVVPVTARSAIDDMGRFQHVLRTRVGSPFVIAGINDLKAMGGKTVVGFEANGGFLLGSDVYINDKFLQALLTRDAILPILATFIYIKRLGLPLSQFVSNLSTGETASGRLSNIPLDFSKYLVSSLEGFDFSTNFLRPIGDLENICVQDGVRMRISRDRVIHFRASGNAPELRCYTEAKSIVDAEELLQWGLRAASAALDSYRSSSAGKLLPSPVVPD